MNFYAEYLINVGDISNIANSLCKGEHKNISN